MLDDTKSHLFVDASLRILVLQLLPSGLRFISVCFSLGVRHWTHVDEVLVVVRVEGISDRLIFVLSCHLCARFVPFGALNRVVTERDVEVLL